MTPLDQDAEYGLAPGQPGPMAYGDRPPGGPRQSEAVLDPELEGSNYQTAPITSLALARWNWAVAGAALGLVLGFLGASVTGNAWSATSVIKMQTSDSDYDGTATQTKAQSWQSQATSDSVLDRAIALLLADDSFTGAGGSFPDGSDDTTSQAAADARAQLAADITAEWETDTNLVNVTAENSIEAIAIAEANAIVNAVVAENQAEAAAKLEQITEEGNNLLSSNTLSASDAESQRKSQIGSDIGSQQSSAATSAQEITAITTNSVVSAGQSPVIAALLGAAGGAFLGALVAVVAGAGRRRLHSPRELIALAPDLTVRTTVQSGELAGRVLETDCRTIVVLGLPGAQFATTQLASGIRNHLMTHGATVAIVNRITDSSQSGYEDRLWALRRDVRRNIPQNFQADLLVVAAPADEEALSLISGQSDLLVTVVARRKKSTLAEIRRTMESVRAADPVVVLAQ